MGCGIVFLDYEVVLGTEVIRVELDRIDSVFDGFVEFGVSFLFVVRYR